jgi:hypothetical protein
MMAKENEVALGMKEPCLMTFTMIEELEQRD